MNKHVSETQELTEKVMEAIKLMDVCPTVRIEVRKEVNGKIFLEVNSTKVFK